MEEIRWAMEDHMNQMADLIQKFSAELRSGFVPASDNFIGFFHAIDWKATGFPFEGRERWGEGCLRQCLQFCSSGGDVFQHCAMFLHAEKEPWLIGLLGFHVLLLLTAILSRRHVNFQMCLFLLALSGVYLAERINCFLGNHWESFATQNYFDPLGLFFSVLWSGPLLIIAVLILVNSLFSLCHLIVRWKRAELRHRARLSEKKTE